MALPLAAALLASGHKDSAARKMPGHPRHRSIQVIIPGMQATRAFRAYPGGGRTGRCSLASTTALACLAWLRHD
jgi:hypothetical protein